MKIARQNLFIQVKYSDLVNNTANIEEYFLGSGGELYLSPEEINSIDKRIVRCITSLSSKKSIPLKLHAPIADINYREIQDTCRSMRALYEKVIRVSSMLHIDSVVAHAEFDYNSNFPIRRQLDNAELLWSELAEMLKKKNVSLYIENHSEPSPEALIALMEKIDLPVFGMCVDIGHFNVFGRPDIATCLEKYPAGSIKEVHLADNMGDDDTHLPLGEGNIDFYKFLSAIEKRNKECFFVLEPNNLREAKRSMLFLKKAGLIE